MHSRELSTPALTIDLDTLDRNLNRMASSCREQGVGLRPHTKAHKTPEVGRMQLDRGAVGLTVAKVGEAEVMAAAGLDDILIAYPILAGISSIGLPPWRGIEMFWFPLTMIGPRKGYRAPQSRRARP